MLGEKIGEISGKITMQRVLPNWGGDPKMETSFQATGSVLGTNIKDTGTYSTIFRPDGTQYGEGQGIMAVSIGSFPRIFATSASVLPVSGFSFSDLNPTSKILSGEPAVR